jgi:tubulin epsilon
MCTVIAPSAEDECGVVISPYNTLMSLANLVHYSNCVFPIENSSLRNYVHGAEHETVEAFDQMNSVVANFLLDLTAGSRFSGRMNVDLREIETNMVPFRNHKFLCSGISPIVPDNAPRTEMALFTEAMSRKATLCDVDAHSKTYLANALLVRGNLDLSVIRSTVNRLTTKMRFPIWNKDGWKIGMCGCAPLYAKRSVLCLTNTSAISGVFRGIVDRYRKLYRARAYVKHYADFGVDLAQMEQAREDVEFLIDEYEGVGIGEVIPPRPTIYV